MSFTSQGMRLTSQRTPKFMVSLGVTFQSSLKNAPMATWRQSGPLMPSRTLMLCSQPRNMSATGLPQLEQRCELQPPVRNPRKR